MLLPHLLALTLALAPSLASAAIFPKDTLVKMLDPKSFKRVMKKNVCFFASLSLSSADTKPPANKRCRVCRAMVWCKSTLLRVDQGVVMTDVHVCCSIAKTWHPSIAKRHLVFTPWFHSTPLIVMQRTINDCAVSRCV